MKILGTCYMRNEEERRQFWLMEEDLPKAGQRIIILAEEKMRYSVKKEAEE